MIWRFKKHQLSDIVKVQQFLEKEDIDYELLLDHVDMQVGETFNAGEQVPLAVATPTEPVTADTAPPLKSGTRPIDTSQMDNDPLWRAAAHDGNVCTDKNGCKKNEHYGAVTDF